MSGYRGMSGPLTFRCGKCRRNEIEVSFTATGRSRVRATQRGHETYHEYRCPACRNVGWTRHRTIALLVEPVAAPTKEHKDG